MRCCLFLPLPCCRHTGQLSLVPSLSGILHANGWAIFVWWCRSRVILLGQIRVFLYKLSYTFSLRRCKKRLSHILCQHLHPWPHWCTTLRSLPPCSCTPITWAATSSPDAIELPPTPSHLSYHWNKAAVICLDAFLQKDVLCTSIALQVSSYEVGISSPKYRFPKARVVLLNVAVSCLNVCLWSKWSISCISDSVHDYSSNIPRFLYWMINIL